MTTGSYDWCSGSGPSSSDFYTHKNWAGDDMPKGWRRAGMKLQSHAYSVTAYRHSQSKSRCYRGTQDLGETYVYYPQFPDGTGFLPPWTPPDANLSLKAVSSLAEAVRQHSFNAGVFAAELPEALSLLKGSVSALCNAALAFARKDWASLVRNLSRAPSGRRAMRDSRTKKRYDACLDRHDLDGAWLAIQYGWRPLVNDIYEAAKAAEKMVTPQRSLHYKAKASCSKTTVFSTRSPANGLMACTDVWTIGYDVTLVEKISTARSLGLLNPATVLWERMPWSFVIDWALPIGAYLDAASCLTGLTFDPSRSSTYNKRARRVNVVRASTTANTWPVADRLLGGGFSSTGYAYTRTLISSVSIPMPSLKTLDKVFSLSHLANAAALISGKLSTTRETTSSRAY